MEREATRAALDAGQSPEDSLKRTRLVWQPRYSRRLTEEDARQIAQNLSGFFETLARWNSPRAESAAVEKVSETIGGVSVISSSAEGMIGSDVSTGRGEYGEVQNGA